MTSLALDRRTLIRSAAALPLARAFPAWAQSGTAGLRPTPGVLSGDRIELAVRLRQRRAKACMWPRVLLVGFDRLAREQRGLVSPPWLG